MREKRQRVAVEFGETAAAEVWHHFSGACSSY